MTILHLLAAATIAASILLLVLIGIVSALLLDTRRRNARSAAERDQVLELIEVLHQRNESLRAERDSDRDILRTAINRLSEPVPGHDLPSQVLAFMQETQRFLIQAIQANGVQANSRIFALVDSRASQLVYSQEHAQRDQALRGAGRPPSTSYVPADTFTEEPPDSAPTDAIRDSPPLSSTHRFTQQDPESPSAVQAEAEAFLRERGLDFSDLDLPPEAPPSDESEPATA